MPDSDILVSKLKLQWQCHVHFRTNTFGKVWTSSLQQEVKSYHFGSTKMDLVLITHESCYDIKQRNQVKTLNISVIFCLVIWYLYFEQYHLYIGILYLSQLIMQTSLVRNSVQNWFCSLNRNKKKLPILICLSFSVAWTISND